MVTKMERGKRDQEYGINRYTLLYVKEISHKDLLYSTRNYIQYRIKPQWKIYHFPGSLTGIKSCIMGYWPTINKLLPNFIQCSLIQQPQSLFPRKLNLWPICSPGSQGYLSANSHSNFVQSFSPSAGLPLSLVDYVVTQLLVLWSGNKMGINPMKSMNFPIRQNPQNHLQEREGK